MNNYSGDSFQWGTVSPKAINFSTKTYINILSHGPILDDFYKVQKSKNVCFFWHTWSHALQASTQVSWWQIHLSVAGPHITCAGCCVPYIKHPHCMVPKMWKSPINIMVSRGCVWRCLKWTGLFVWLVKNTTQQPTWGLIKKEKHTRYISFQDKCQTSDGWCSMNFGVPHVCSRHFSRQCYYCCRWAFRSNFLNVYKDYVIPLMLVKQ